MVELICVLCGSGRLAQYRRGDLGLVPRQEHCMSAGSVSRQGTIDRRAAAAKKVACRAIATQTVSAVKVRSLHLHIECVIQSH